MKLTVLIEKEVIRTDKNGENVSKNISYTLQFIDSTRFMEIFFSNFVKNPSKGIHKIKCKHGLAELNIFIATVFLTIKLLGII